MKKSWSPLIFGLNSRLEFLEVKREEKPKSKGPYKNKVYCSISEKYGIKITENELDELTEKLLEQYFSKKKKK